MVKASVATLDLPPNAPFTNFIAEDAARLIIPMTTYWISEEGGSCLCVHPLALGGDAMTPPNLSTDGRSYPKGDWTTEGGLLCPSGDSNAEPRL